MARYLVGYLVCGIIAVPVLWLWWRYLIRRTECTRGREQESAPRIAWFPIMTGIFERLIYTTLVGFEVSGAAAFVGAWVTIKAIGGWVTWSKDSTPYGKALFFSGLLGSAMSLLFGVAGGLIISKCKW
ncbi:MAG TPA: hypothetical protein VKF36_04450 [Syntrophorhabdales bacterium]|nr:hypothetical protein [Syntrophorhabdales bacterium]